MWAHPGKKLLFMGAEWAQEAEWNHDGELDWRALADPAHAGVQRLIGDLNRLYRRHAALHALDGEPAGFRWLVAEDRAHSVFAFCRFADGASPPVLAVSNFTPVPRYHYRLGVPREGLWRELVNTDADAYGGSNIGNGGEVLATATAAHGYPCSLELTLPPLATLYLQADAGGRH